MVPDDRDPEEEHVGRDGADRDDDTERGEPSGGRHVSILPWTTGRTRAILARSLAPGGKMLVYGALSSHRQREITMKTQVPTILPGVERHVRAFLEELNASGGKLEELAPKDARAVLVNAQASVKLDLPKCDVAEKVIHAGGQNIALHIVRPAGVKETLPVFMFFHGGGWVLGDFPTHERLVRDLVAGSGAAAVFVDYTPSPEAQYPAAINQAYAATQWVAQNGREINVEGTHLAVVGNSVGGNMAAVVSLMAKDKGTPAIKFQVLMWPVTDANFENTSFNLVPEGHFLSRDLMKWFWDNYTTDPRQRKEIYAAPLQATLRQLKGLPPALIQVAEFDVLRDEGEVYGRKLDAAGVDVTVTRYNGMIHDWGLLNAISQVSATRSAIRQASAEIRSHLQS